MSNQEGNKLNVEPKSEANFDDLQVQDVAEDSVKGGRAGYYEYHVVATGETFNR
jgi:hypothetical protein